MITRSESSERLGQFLSRGRETTHNGHLKTSNIHSENIKQMLFCRN